MVNSTGKLLKLSFEADALCTLAPRVLVVVTELPSGAVETQVNYEDLEGKIKYIQDTYDDEFVMRHNKNIKVVGYVLA